MDKLARAMPSEKVLATSSVYQTEEKPPAIYDNPFAGMESIKLYGDVQQVEIATGLKDKKNWPKKVGKFIYNILKKQDGGEVAALASGASTIPASIDVDLPAGERTANDVQRAITRQQVAIEASYHIAIDPVAHSEQLNPEDILDRMEIDHVVKDGPRLSEQINEERTNIVKYWESPNEEGSRTEHEVLDELNTYLETAMACGRKLGDGSGAAAKSLHDNLTFIGEKEYQEATTGIALYWKALLDRHPEQQILALAGITKKFSHFRDKKEEIKSDDYLLDNILAHFSDEEVEKYKGRLITDSSEIATKDASDLRVILLDDWTISGSQLQSAASGFRHSFPQFASSVEIQLIVANNERITRGLDRMPGDPSFRSDLPVPVRAYFRAHDAPAAPHSEAHITGSHSSVDYDFETTIDEIVTTARGASNLSNKEHTILDARPALVRISRSYRSPKVHLAQRDRFRLGDGEQSSSVYSS
ncbi:MAG TPA: hypothetical protein VK497_02910 [Candidatus Saccharimonadales bacterium]|nr:hypothetical protein [Candidatus Saccharimonadales bacterium]